MLPEATELWSLVSAAAGSPPVVTSAGERWQPSLGSPAGARTQEGPWLQAGCEVLEPRTQADLWEPLGTAAEGTGQFGGREAHAWLLLAPSGSEASAPAGPCPWVK